MGTYVVARNTSARSSLLLGAQHSSRDASRAPRDADGDEHRVGAGSRVANDEDGSGKRHATDPAAAQHDVGARAGSSSTSLRSACVELRPQLSELTVSVPYRIIPIMTSMMTSILQSVIVLALLTGISGCLFPWERRGDWREHRYEQGYRGDREDQARRDCWNRDGHWYCRDGN